MFFLIVVRVASALCSVFEALALKDLINNAVSKNKPEFITYCFVFGGLILAQICMGAIGRYLDERVKASIENQLKSRLFNTLLRKDFASVTARHSGEWMMRLTSDTVVVATNAADILPNVLSMIARLVGAIALIFTLLANVAWIIIPCAALSIVITLVLRKRLKVLHKRIQESDGRLRSFLAERLSNLIIIRRFAMEEQTLGQADDKMDDHYKKRMARVRFLNFCNVCFNLLIYGLYIAAVIYCGRGILIGNINYGTFAAITKLVGEIRLPIANVSSYIPRWYSMLASAERLMEAEDYKDDIEGEKKSAAEVRRFYENEFAGMGLRNARFSYVQPGKGLDVVAGKENDPLSGGLAGDDDRGSSSFKNIVIDGVSFDINKQDIAAVTGPSGSGKSTLLKLMMSFYPLQGGESVLYVKENTMQSGADVSSAEKFDAPAAVSGLQNGTLPLDPSWRGLFAYVPQGNQLMSGSIRDVLTFGDRSVSLSELDRALEVACAAEFIKELPSGLETVLGERGSGLSEGQIQRLAIARAIISGHPVLLLDEATSSLDEATEERLLRNLKALTDRTVIIVTHRMKVLSICSAEIHMSDDGCIDTRRL